MGWHDLFVFVLGLFGVCWIMRWGCELCSRSAFFVFLSSGYFHLRLSILCDSFSQGLIPRLQIFFSFVRSLITNYLCFLVETFVLRLIYSETETWAWRLDSKMDSPRAPKPALKKTMTKVSVRTVTSHPLEDGYPDGEPAGRRKFRAFKLKTKFGGRDHAMELVPQPSDDPRDPLVRLSLLAPRSSSSY
jgi:hypothetical protein